MSIFKIAQWLIVWQMASECCIYAEILFALRKRVEKSAFLQKCTSLRTVLNRTVFSLVPY